MMDQLTSERLIWATLARTGRVDGVLDLKCGEGWKVKAVKSTGIRPALGIGRSIPEKDATNIPNSIIIKDMFKRFDMENVFELVICVDIDEVPFDRREVFVGNAARHSEKWLLIDGEEWLLQALEKQGFALHSAMEPIGDCKPTLLLRRTVSS